MPKKDNVKNRLYIRVYDDNQLKEMDGLIASKKYSSKSEIVGKCIDIALPLLVSGKALSTPKNDDKSINDIIKKQYSLLRDLSVITNITFNLIQSIFTQKALELDGKNTNAYDLNNGLYEQLPEHYQNLFAELMK